jgi:hypothetical protein
VSTAAESKHTPGPWRISGAAEGAGITIEGKRNSLIAFVRDNQHPLTDVSEHEATANALLIAAAPAMLEALETYAMRYAQDEAGDSECCSPQQHEDAKALFAAIKLAKGESQ